LLRTPGLREAVKEPIRSKVGALRTGRGKVAFAKTASLPSLRAAMGERAMGRAKRPKERGEKICAHVPAPRK